jgi:membrane protein DedA with SNARE-associated domain
VDDIPFGFLIGYGIAGIAALALLERFLPVLPSYVLFVVIGFVAVDHVAALPAVALAASAGSLGGAVGWYAIGRLFGAARCERLIARWGSYVFLPMALYRRLAASYARRQFWVTLVGQTVPTVRIYLPLPAGVIGLAPVPFLAASALGVLAWNTPLIALGYALRDSGVAPLAIGIAFAVALLLVEGGALLALWRRRATESGRAG